MSTNTYASRPISNPLTRKINTGNGKLTPEVYNNNVPSETKDPTPITEQPVISVSPTDIKATDVEMPANTSQINYTSRPGMSATSAPSNTTTKSAESSHSYLWIIGAVVIAILIFLYIKYKK